MRRYYLGSFFMLSRHDHFWHHKANYSDVHRAETVPLRTVNRQCSSGLQAVVDVVSAIRAGFYDIGEPFKKPSVLVISLWNRSLDRSALPRQCRNRRRLGVHDGWSNGLGRIHQSQGASYPFIVKTRVFFHPRRTSPSSFTASLQTHIFSQAQDCLLPMGITSENVAHRFGVSREEQDRAAVSSQTRALRNSIIFLFWVVILMNRAGWLPPQGGRRNCCG